MLLIAGGNVVRGNGSCSDAIIEIMQREHVPILKLHNTSNINVLFSAIND